MTLKGLKWHNLGDHIFSQNVKTLTSLCKISRFNLRPKSGIGSILPILVAPTSMSSSTHEKKLHQSASCCTTQNIHVQSCTKIRIQKTPLALLTCGNGQA